jgi:hypothetical protein
MPCRVQLTGKVRINCMSQGQSSVPSRTGLCPAQRGSPCYMRSRLIPRPRRRLPCVGGHGCAPVDRCSAAIPWEPTAAARFDGPMAERFQSQDRRLGRALAGAAAKHGCSRGDEQPGGLAACRQFAARRQRMRLSPCEQCRRVRGRPGAEGQGAQSAESHQNRAIATTPSQPAESELQNQEFWRRLRAASRPAKVAFTLPVPNSKICHLTIASKLADGPPSAG